MKLKNNPYFRKIVRDLFLILLSLFFVFVVLEFFKPGLVVNYLRLDLYLLVLFLAGVVNVIWQPQITDQSLKLNFLDYFTIILISILIGIAIVFLTKLGLLGILLGFLSAVISYFFIIFIYSND